nr:hypothetical protein [Tanacetum cinerariifolium]
MSTIVRDLKDKGVASIVTSSPSSEMISKHCLRFEDSLSSSIFYFLALSCSSSSPALFELPSVTFALALGDSTKTTAYFEQQLLELEKQQLMKE